MQASGQVERARAMPTATPGKTRSFLRFVATTRPGRALVIVPLLILAGLAEGVGLAAMLPLVQAVAGSAGSPDGAAAGDGLVAGALAAAGLRPTLETVLVLIVAMITLKGALMWVAMRQVGYTAATVATDLRRRLIRALTLAEWRHFATQPTGHLTSAVSDQASRSALAYADACACAADLIQAAIYFLLVFYISPGAAVMTVLSGALMAWLFGRFVRSSRAAGADQTRLMRTVVARLTELLATVKPVKAMGREGDVWPLLERETEEFQVAQRRLILAQESVAAFYDPIAALIIAVGLYLALAYASLPMTELFVLAVIGYRMIVKASQAQARYQRVIGNESALWSLLGHIDAAHQAREGRPAGAAGPVGPAGATPPHPRRVFTLDQVSVAFDGRPVLDRVSLSLPAGRLIAVSGPSGAGKTTLVDVVIGLLKPDSGRILIDGVPLDEVDLGAWRRRVGYVPQEVLLFHDTIRANVALGSLEASDDDVVAALKAAGAWAFVQELPGGLDHRVGERGVTISGGQRQRIMIARALVARPDVLVLDEATAGLDPPTEAAIIATLAALRPAVTIFAISHQPAMAEAADLVVHVGRGHARIEARPEVSPVASPVREASA